MKLIRIDRGVYETANKRFLAVWSRNQGARSSYLVRDNKTVTSQRAFTLKEVRATIRNMLRIDRLPAVVVKMQAPVVYLAVREVPRRFMGPRTEPKFEAELRERVKDKYVTRGHVARSTRAKAIDAARALAKRRGWQIDETKRPSWHTRDTRLERMLAEEAREAPAIAEAAESPEVLEQAPAIRGDYAAQMLLGRLRLRLAVIAETADQPEGEAAQIVRWMRATFGYRIRKEVYDAIERGDWRTYDKRSVR